MKYKKPVLIFKSLDSQFFEVLLPINFCDALKNDRKTNSQKYRSLGFFNKLMCEEN